MTHRPYPAYKDSGIEWLGDASTGSAQGIPEHWDICALKRIASLKSGEMINSERIEVEGMYPVYGGGGFRGYTEAYTHEGEFALIGRQGALCGNINYGTGKFWASEHAVVVSPIRGLETHWVGELLRSMNLNQYSVSAAQPGLSVEAISNLLVPVPPLPEQQAIAAFLDRETAKIDGLVAEQERLIELLTEKRQAVISHAVTRGLNPSVALKDSGVEWLGKVPEHWEVFQVKHLAKDGVKTFTDGDWIESPYVTDDGVRLIQTGNVGIGYYKEQGFRYVSEESFLSLGCTEVSPRDVLICRLDGPVGRACLAPDLGVRMITSVDNAILKVSSEVLPDFVVSIMSSIQWISWIDALCRVGGGFRLRISRSQLGELRCALPPLPEQQAIAAYLDEQTARFDALMAEARRGIELLKERRTALISAAVTGKIDVREAA